jgi:hypothetical protein
MDQDEDGRGGGFYGWLMGPSNAICDALDLHDEHERGMIRMLVNTLIWTAIGATAFFVAWMKFVK